MFGSTLNDKPDGRVPTAENVTLGAPVAVSVRLEYEPMVIVPLAALVIAGATPALDFHENKAQPASDHHNEPSSVDVAT